MITSWTKGTYSMDAVSARRQGLSTLETIVADFGDNLSPKTATVAQFGDYSRQCGQAIWRQSPFLATVAKFGNSRRFWQQSPNWATIVASVDRPSVAQSHIHRDARDAGSAGTAMTV